MTTDTKKMLAIRDCGLMPYRKALDLQLELAAGRQTDSIGNTLLILEHPPVITLGARKTENKLLLDTAGLQAKGIEVVAIGRGGGTTAHNPGQLVLYPILKLRSLNLDITSYIRQLEQIGIELLAELGVLAARKPGFPGLWVGNQKIASIGVQVKKWVTLHGIAVNISNDLSIFDCIIPCGLNGVAMTSVLEQTSAAPDMTAVRQLAANCCLTLWSSRNE